MPTGTIKLCNSPLSTYPDVTIDIFHDIKYMARPVLDHRLILRPEYEIEGLTVNEVIQDILQGIAVPR